jgi:hypothetical protein
VPSDERGPVGPFVGVRDLVLVEGADPMEERELVA